MFSNDDSWREHGPGTMEWDYVFGGNHTGLYPDKTLYSISDDRKQLVKYRAVHAGGGKWDFYIHAAWDIERLTVLEGAGFSCVFYVPETGQWFRADASDEFGWDDGVMVTVAEIEEPGTCIY